MKIHSDYSLFTYNTLGIEAIAKQFVEITSIEELKKILLEHTDSEKFILGGGSNVLLTERIEKLCISLKNKGIELISQNEKVVELEIAAGEVWHDVVLWCVDHGYGGIENLALIPGSAGAAPIQNIGAYGVEIKDVLISCDVVELNTARQFTLNVKDLELGYRDSVFKRTSKNKYVIVSIKIRLTKPGYHKYMLSYGKVKEMLGDTKITLKSIADAIISIRNEKIPNPKQIPNAGSFFKNVIIDNTLFQELKKNNPEIPSYKLDQNKIKIPTAWLIEKAGFKGIKKGKIGVHDKQALVIVNPSRGNAKDIMALVEEIKASIKKQFEIELELEVNLI